ncbi:MAG: hypothetical protein OXG59_04315 [Gammaproteobacteria bacterium]|nr:hypothetical protein [Gammaproteobacteria bacterium]
MKVLRRALLALAGAVLAVQPALACHCPEDLLAHARETSVEEPACHESTETGHTDTQQGDCPQCADCGDYEPASAPSAAQAVASNHLPEFNPAPAIAGHPAVTGRPQTVRNIGPPPAIPRAALTPVLLKQRLLT